MNKINSLVFLALALSTSSCAFGMVRQPVLAKEAIDYIEAQADKGKALWENYSSIVKEIPSFYVLPQEWPALRAHLEGTGQFGNITDQKTIEALDRAYAQGASAFNTAIANTVKFRTQSSRPYNLPAEWPMYRAALLGQRVVRTAAVAGGPQRPVQPPPPVPTPQGPAPVASSSQKDPAVIAQIKVVKEATRAVRKSPEAVKYKEEIDDALAVQ